ncbi:MAG: hypothetical protein HY300_16100 [Verrucomicrobia bacterium]|nr:hypothetical protein [Verrucomicrobiota bacterium]
MFFGSDTRPLFICLAFAASAVSLPAPEKPGLLVRPAAAPLSIHPENPKYFLFRGKPLALITATEHYGSIINRPFDFARYLAEAADKKQTLTRTFLLFRELQTTRNPESPCKPESPDYLAPFPRTGPGLAKDGELRYDLDQWNPEFFDRLHRFLSLASKRGIVVELTLFSNTYGTNLWELNPFCSTNNLQSVGQGRWSDYTSLNDQPLFERQAAYARKVIQETVRYDNVYYELCNEPGGGLTNQATVAEVDAWQRELGRVAQGELQRLGAKHLVFGSQAFSYKPRFEQRLDASFASPQFDGVNVHPLPNTVFGGRAYNLGEFMGKQLKLAELRDFCAAVQHEGKPCVLDEDNAASLYHDDVGWTIHRKRAWIALMSHFIHMRTMPAWLETKPAQIVAVMLAKSGADYVAYLADAREVSEPDSGEPINGELSFTLPEGTFRARFYSPVTGKYFGGQRLHGGTCRIALPRFQHDIVLRVTKT